MSYETSLPITIPPKYEKFYDIKNGNNYYAVLATVIIIPIGTTLLAYKKPIKSFYYLNMFIGLSLIGYAIYVSNQYQSIYTYPDDEIFNDKLVINGNIFEYKEMIGLQQKSDEYKNKVESEIGKRCTFISIVSISLGLFSLIWSGRKISES